MPSFSSIVLLFVFASSLLMSVACDKHATQATTTSRPEESTAVKREAEAGPVRMTVEVDRAKATVPEQIRLILTVVLEKGVQVELPEIAGTLGDFSVEDVVDSEPEQGEFVETYRRVVRLDAVLPGSCTIPSLSVTFVDPREKADGSDEPYADQVTTEPIAITVLGGLADIKGPVTVPLPWQYRLIGLTTCAMLAMVAVALLARWWVKRARAHRALRAEQRRLLPHEWAMSELDKLAAEGLIDRGLVREFYYRINTLLRKYIELRFDLMAGEQTSEEFIRSLQDGARFDERHKQVLRRFVAACDPVKYARQQPSADEVDWVQVTARDFVQETATNDGQPVGEPEAGRMVQGARGSPGEPQTTGTAEDDSGNGGAAR